MPPPPNNRNPASPSGLGGFGAIAAALQNGFAGLNSGLLSGFGNVLNSVFKSAAAQSGTMFQNVTNSFVNSAKVSAQSVESEFHRVFQTLRMGIFAVEANVASFVRLANPGVYVQFNRAVEDLYGVIGRALTPVLQNATVIVQKLADYMNALGPAGKFAIIAVAGMATAAGAGVGAFVGLGVAISAVSFIIDIATGGTAALFQVLGALVGALAGAGIAGGTLAAGFGFLVAPIDQLKKMLDAIMPAFSAIAEVVGGVLAEAMSIIVPLVRAASTMIASMVQAAMPVIKTAIELFVASIAAVGAVIGTVLLAITAVIALPLVVLASLVTVINQVISKIFDLSKAFSYVAAFLELFADAIGGGGGKVPDKAPPAVRNVQAGTLAGAITRQQTLALQGGGSQENPLKAATDNLRTSIDAAKAEIIALVTAIRENINYVKGAASGAAGAAADATNRVAEGLFGPFGRMMVRGIVGK